MPKLRKSPTRLSLAGALFAIAAMAAMIVPGSAVPAPGDSANLGISKSDSPDPVVEGAVLTYTLTITNGGPDAATGVVVEDTLPANVTYLSASASQGSCNRTGRRVVCTLGSMGFGTIGNVTTPTIEIRVRPRQVGTITNTATVDSVENDPVAANNTATATTRVIAAPGPGPGPGPGPTPPQCAGRNATKVGTAGADRLVGTPRSDVIVARGGNDTVFTFGGRDFVCGNGGNDYVVSGADADRVIGGFGNDRVLGRAGNDTLAGNAGRDVLRGGLGADTLLGGRGFDTCLGGAGADTRRSCERP